MRNGTRLGLTLIALAWLAASTSVSAHFIARAAQDSVRTHTKFTAPIVKIATADI